MKTPRQILLQHHQAANPALDRIRAGVIAGVDRRAPHHTLRELARLLWRELIWPCRHTWAVLATAWVALGVFQGVSSSRTGSPGQSVAGAHQVSVALSFSQQRELISELIPPSRDRLEKPVPADLPKPRSQAVGGARTC